MRIEFAIAVSLLVSACASDARACELLNARCPAPENREACPVAVRAIREKDGASGVRKATACLEKAKTCGEAAVCLAPDVKTGWTDYAPNQ